MTRRARIFFIEMMGEPGSFDTSVYHHLEEREDEGLWFVKRFGDIPGISISTRNVCIDEPLPEIDEVDGLVLAGTYNSVHDHRPWQQRVRDWLPGMRAASKPILGVCGSHQLIAHAAGADVDKLAEGPFAGTFPVELTDAGKASPLLRGIDDGDCFQYANGEHVLEVPSGARLLASSRRVPVAALDYGDDCYTTQFHPEGTDRTLGCVWQHIAPDLMQNYHACDKGFELVDNFVRLVVERLPQAANHAVDSRATRVSP